MSDDCPPTNGTDSQTGTDDRVLISYGTPEPPVLAVETDEGTGVSSFELSDGWLVTVSRIQAKNCNGIPLDTGVMPQ